MRDHSSQAVGRDSVHFYSASLDRSVYIDLYLPPSGTRPDATSLLLLNDGQDLPKMPLEAILEDLYRFDRIQPLLCVGIHCGEDRKNEYGMIHHKDYAGRGAKAPLYRKFLFEELFPLLEANYSIHLMERKAIAGFSLGGLSALDLAWLHPETFSVAGIFSGALWWRSVDKILPAYDDRTCRLMHMQVRDSIVPPSVKLFFSCGEQDEMEDRNKNGVIDAIDDTIDLLRELLHKGFQEGKDIAYLQLPDGRHDVATWAKAMPHFLKWGWGKP
jgi:enterochelin esterase-like enzyme